MRLPRNGSFPPASFAPGHVATRCLIFVAILAVPSIGAGTAAAGSGAHIKRGPYLQALSPSSVEIRAELDTAAPATVTLTRRAPDGGAPRIVPDARTLTTHVVRIDGLAPSTRYGYSFEVAAQSVSGEFTTAPPDDSNDPFTFLAYGDNRTDEVAHAAIVRKMLESPSDFLIHTGDYVQNGGVDADWQTFFDVEEPLLRDRCVYGCVGNHELVDGAGAGYLRLFGPVMDARGPAEKPKLYGSFRWGNARFFLLDAMASFDPGPERSWLDDELTHADAEKVTWRIVVLHHSPWSAGPHGSNRRAVSAGIPALFAAHHVDLVLAGHDHIYERGFAAGLPYLVTGGGGAPLYPIDHLLPTTRKAESVHHFVEVTVKPEYLQLVATREDGSVLDRCGLVKATGQWDCDPAPVAGASPSPANPSAANGSSRCGCDVVGVSSAPRAWCAGVALLALAFVRRRRLQ